MKKGRYELKECNNYYEDIRVLREIYQLRGKKDELSERKRKKIKESIEGSYSEYEDKRDYATLKASIMYIEKKIYEEVIIDVLKGIGEELEERERINRIIFLDVLYRYYFLNNYELLEKVYGCIRGVLEGVEGVGNVEYEKDISLSYTLYNLIEGINVRSIRELWGYKGGVEYEVTKENKKDVLGVEVTRGILCNVLGGVVCVELDSGVELKEDIKEIISKYILKS